MLNYNEEFKKIIKNIDKDNKPSLLLHACCSPCLIGVFDKVIDYFNVTIFYYNPNLYPNEEYYIRLEEIKKLITYYSLDVELIVVDHLPDEFYKAVKGQEHLGERTERCVSCITNRLERAAIYAKNNGFDYFATTLTISSQKDTKKINEIQNDLSLKHEIKCLPSDFKKENGLLNSINRSKELNLYRQDYCGCVFSKKERDIRIASKLTN